MEDFNVHEDHGNQEKRRGRGAGWMIATLALVAFLGGALVMKYLPGSGGDSNVYAASAAPTAASADVTKKPDATPSSTLPVLGGGNAVSLENDAAIPAIVKADGPAVVGVLNKVKGGQFGFGSSTNDQTQGSGSGVIISKDGYIVTNNHVVAGADSISVVLPGGKEVAAEVVGSDAQSDLAVLKIAETGLPVIDFGNSDSMQVGDPVVAIGNPMGMELAGTVTHGIISGKNREITIDGYTYKVLQTDAAINPGNSGGALVSSDGKLIGINNAKDPSAEGIGFALPINQARPVIEQLIQNHGISRPMLGIEPVDITKDMAYYNNYPVGVGIRSVSQNGPAAKAGLMGGDIIVEFDGQKVESLTQIRDIMNKHAVGDMVKVKVFRTGTKEDKTVNLTLGNSMDLTKQQ